jgi:hypothetical protein
MGKNDVLERASPVYTGETIEKDEILVLLEKIIEIMNKGFENMNTRFRLMEEQLNGLQRLLEQMNIYK